MRGERYIDSAHPCFRHGMTERYRRNGECVECRKDKNSKVSPEAKAKYRQTQKEKKALKPSRTAATQQALTVLREYHVEQGNAEFVELIDKALSPKRDK